jgi:streptogramin lyase
VVLALALALVASGSALGAPLGQISDFLTPTMNSQPEGIVAGPDGNLWFAEFSGNKIAEVNPTTRAITEFSVPTAMSQPLGVALGPDGSIWFTEFAADKIAEINPVTHAITQFNITTANSGPVAIVEGPDGNMWFTEFAAGKVAEFNLATRTFTEFPTTTANSGPFGIAAGPDGNIWFTEKAVSQIGVLNLGTHTVTEVKTPTANAAPNAIAAGPDGNMWFTEMATGVKGIGEINPSSKVPVEFQTPTANAQPTVIAPGPDGNMWFTENANPGHVGFINPFTHAFGTEFTTPTPNSGPVGIATGADGNLWFTENGAGRVGAIGAGAPAPLLLAPTIAGAAQPGATLVCQPAAFAAYAGLEPSASEFGFDGFRWLLNGAQIATSQSITISAADVGGQLACQETVSYPLVGPTTSATSAPVTVSPSLGASLVRTALSGNISSLTIACVGLPTQTCSGPVTVTSRVTTQGSKTIAVAARSRHKRKPPKKLTKTVTVATGSYSVAASHSATIRVKLNAAGQKLLNAFYRLPAQVTIGGTTPIAKPITFSYGRLHISPAYGWVFTSTYAYATKLTLPGLPSKAKTTVVCRGHGCPFSQRTFSAPKHGTLNIAPALKQRHLAPHATVEVQLTMANTVGEVVLFTVGSGQQPKESFLCLPPGARRPGACA